MFELISLDFGKNIYLSSGMLQLACVGGLCIPAKEKCYQLNQIEGRT